jgi:hypothetical protein
MCHVHQRPYEQAPDPAEVGLENLVVGDNDTYATKPLGDPRATSHVVTGVRTEQEQAVLDAESQVVQPDLDRMRNAYYEATGNEADEDMTVGELQFAVAQAKVSEAERIPTDEELAERREQEKIRLRDQFKELTGEDPDKRWGNDRLQQEILNHQADQALQEANAEAEAEAEADTGDDGDDGEPGDEPEGEPEDGDE